MAYDGRQSAELCYNRLTPLAFAARVGSQKLIEKLVDRARTLDYEIQNPRFARALIRAIQANNIPSSQNFWRPGLRLMFATTILDYRWFLW